MYIGEPTMYDMTAAQYKTECTSSTSKQPNLSENNVTLKITNFILDSKMFETQYFG